MITLQEADNLSPSEIKYLYIDHVNNNIPKILGLLGLAKEEPQYAEGMFIYTKSGNKIFDFTGGVSVLNLGHNHPRILRARQKYAEKKYMEVWKFFLSPYLAALSKNLADLAPGNLAYPFFCNSGAEANEGALKIAEKYQGKSKDKIVYTDKSYHGKTHATLSVSGIDDSKKHFKVLDGCIEIPYGNSDEFESAIKKRCDSGARKNDICAIILESVTASTITIPPRGYLKEIRRLCDEHDILMIVDDVFLGFGRTGKMFSFEHENIIPDIFTVSKSLGGGKASLAAYIVKDDIYKKAYGDMKNYMIHSTTFNGLGEECYTAIEALNVLIDENLVENSKTMGEYLLSRLKQLKERHPTIIKDVRGIGLLNCIELETPGKNIIDMVGKGSKFFRDMGSGIFPGMIISQLFKQHNILVTAGVYENNIIVINPPLIVNNEHIDYLISSINDYFSKGWFQMAVEFGRTRLISSG